MRPLLMATPRLGFERAWAFQLPFVAPDLPARRRINGERGLADREKDAPIIENRARLGRRLDAAVQRAHRPQPRDVCCVDLIECDVAMSIVALVGHEPAVGRCRGGIKFCLRWTGRLDVSGRGAIESCEEAPNSD